MTVMILLQTPLFWYEIIIKILVLADVWSTFVNLHLFLPLSTQKSEFIDRVDLEGNEDRTHSPVSEDKPKTQVCRCL